MKVLRVGFVGVRTERVAEMTTFFRDVVGLKPLGGTGEGHTISGLPTGPWDFVEVFAPDFDDERLISPEADGVFVAFFVADLEEARRECEAAGVEVLGETVCAAEAFGKPEYAGVGWFFVRGPDGNVYVFQQTPDSK